MTGFDRFAGRYHDNLNQLLGKVGSQTLEFAQQKAVWLTRLATAYVGAPRHLRILDVGCGTGNVTMFLQDVFGESVGADIAHTLLAEAAEKAPRARFVPLPQGPWPFSEGEFDLAFCAGVFHHLKDPDLPGLCHQLARVIRPGGLVVTFEHNPYNPVTRKIVRECDLDWDVERLIPMRQTRALFQGTGLSIARQAYISFFPGALRWLRPLERLLEWLPLGGQYLVAGQKPQAFRSNLL